MRIAYFDCFSGASGDMILGAMVDAGLALEELSASLGSLPLSGYRLTVERVRRGAIAAAKVNVEVEAGRQPARNLRAILEIIAASGLSDGVKGQGARIFQRLAAAEARVHGQSPEEIHFHEVGAIDAIVDVVGSVIGLELLGVEGVYSSPLPSGSGTVETSHGILPLPAPATVELAAMAGAPMRSGPSFPFEFVTPTGAAILTTLAKFEQPSLVLQSIGYGAGSRDLPGMPNVLRLWLGETTSEAEDGLLLFETNIDDMSPELCGYVMERLFARGALDVWFTPIQMKKNRPAVMLSALARRPEEDAVVDTILKETSTLGVRVQPVQRHETSRESVAFESSLGGVSVKLKRIGGAIAGIAPEFEDCRRIAQERQVPLQQVYRTVITEAQERLQRPLGA
ncbi:MAG: nickel pincer cofactor biosynthesis protein LarC [Chloroflexi bacterium]|nr:nickel pincer cofactor biosynthesis protein LarC [Chloroflexota bacterium]